MTWIKHNWFKVVISLVLVLGIMSIRSYLKARNEIEAYNKRAQCKATPGSEWNSCEDIIYH